MSAATARVRPATRPERLHEVAPARLSVVEGVAPRRSTIPMALLALLVLVIAVVTPMVINTRMAETSFDIKEQQILLNQLDAEASTLRTQLQEKSSPTSLDKKARAAGMVPAGRTGIIRLETGTVEGGVAAQ